MVIDDFYKALARARELHDDKGVYPRVMSGDLFEEVVEAQLAHMEGDWLSLYFELLDVAVVAYRIACGEFTHAPQDYASEDTVRILLQYDVDLRLDNYREYELTCIEGKDFQTLLSYANLCALALYQTPVDTSYLKYSMRCAGLALSLASVMNDSRKES